MILRVYLGNVFSGTFPNHEATAILAYSGSLIVYAWFEFLPLCIYVYMRKPVCVCV